MGHGQSICSDQSSQNRLKDIDFTLLVEPNTDRYGFQILPNSGKGDCLFYSLAQAVKNESNVTLRGKIVTYAIRHWRKFGPLLLAQHKDEVKEFDEPPRTHRVRKLKELYIEYMGGSAWGTAGELFIAAEMLKFNVNILCQEAGSRIWVCSQVFNENFAWNHFRFSGSPNHGHWELLIPYCGICGEPWPELGRLEPGRFQQVKFTPKAIWNGQTEIFTKFDSKKWTGTGDSSCPEVEVCNLHEMDKDEGPRLLGIETSKWLPSETSPETTTTTTSVQVESSQFLNGLNTLFLLERDRIISPLHAFLLALHVAITVQEDDATTTPDPSNDLSFGLPPGWNVPDVHDTYHMAYTDLEDPEDATVHFLVTPQMDEESLRVEVRRTLDEGWIIDSQMHLECSLAGFLVDETGIHIKHSDRFLAEISEILNLFTNTN